MTKYLQIARRASEKPPLSIQIYFRCFVVSFVCYSIRLVLVLGSKVFPSLCELSIIILFASDARALSAHFALQLVMRQRKQLSTLSLSFSLSLTLSASPFPTPFCCSQDAPPGSKLLRCAYRQLPRVDDKELKQQQQQVGHGSRLTYKLLHLQVKFIIACRSALFPCAGLSCGRNTLSPAYATHKSCLTCNSSVFSVRI